MLGGETAQTLHSSNIPTKRHEIHDDKMMITFSCDCFPRRDSRRTFENQIRKKKTFQCALHQLDLPFMIVKTIQSFLPDEF